MFNAFKFRENATSLCYTIFPDTIIGKGIFLVSIGFVILLIVSWRFCYNIILQKGIWNQKIILLGSGKFSNLIANEIRRRPDCGYTIALRLLEGDNEFYEDTNFGGRNSLLNNNSNVSDKADELNVSKIVVALKERRGAKMLTGKFSELFRKS